jgi:hypothetical protein
MHDLPLACLLKVEKKWRVSDFTHPVSHPTQPVNNSVEVCQEIKMRFCDLQLAVTLGTGLDQGFPRTKARIGTGIAAWINFRQQRRC